MGIFYRKRARGGFTLIEIVMVVAVLAILVAMAVPRFLGYTAVPDATASQTSASANVPTVSQSSGRVPVANTAIVTNDHSPNDWLAKMVFVLLVLVALGLTADALYRSYVAPRRQDRAVGAEKL